jgi:hypothetical protein
VGSPDTGCQMAQACFLHCIFCPFQAGHLEQYPVT